MTNKKTCYICSSDRFVDDHHVDCCEGKLSPEKEPLCRRCHRTYHDLGVDYFDDEYLDKAIELENRHRQIVYASLKDPVKPLELLKREDIRRSAYWNKQHGISPSPLKERGKPSKGVPFRMPNNPPLCGEEWLYIHLRDHTAEEISALAIEVGCGNRWLPPVSVAAKRGKVKAIVRSLGDAQRSLIKRRRK